MKKVEFLGKSLSKDEMKKVMGGRSALICVCNNGTNDTIVCTGGNTTSCRNTVISQCGGSGATCSFQ